MGQMAYKGYSARVDFDDADGIFFGHVAGLRDRVNFQGETVEELRAAMRNAVEGYLDACTRTGLRPEKSYSGRLRVRIAPEVHAKACFAAELGGVSLAEWMAETLQTATASH